MVQKVESINFWRSNNPIIQQNLDLLNQLPFQIPELYIKLLFICNGGRVDYDFKYYDMTLTKAMHTGIDVFFGLGLDDYDLIQEYRDPADMFPENILAFSTTGNGDKICFDYREDPNTDNPPVVYWNHEADVGNDVSFVAKDFESFLQLLEEPKD